MSQRKDLRSAEADWRATKQPRYVPSAPPKAQSISFKLRWLAYGIAIGLVLAGLYLTQQHCLQTGLVCVD